LNAFSEPGFLVPQPSRSAYRQLSWKPEHTYGGDQVSTWSVLRQSCEPRSPVGLVNQPAPKQVRTRTNSHSPP